MLLYYPFWMFMGFILHIYIIFGTNLLTGGPAHIAVFFAYFSISKKRNIKRSPNGMKPSGAWFWEQTWSRWPGVQFKKQPRPPRDRRARSPIGRAPYLVSSLMLAWLALQVPRIASVPKITFPKVSFRLDSVWYSFSSKHWNRQENNNMGWASGLYVSPKNDIKV